MDQSRWELIQRMQAQLINIDLQFWGAYCWSLAHLDLPPAQADDAQGTLRALRAGLIQSLQREADLWHISLTITAWSFLSIDYATADDGVLGAN